MADSYIRETTAVGQLPLQGLAAPSAGEKQERAAQAKGMLPAGYDLTLGYADLDARAVDGDVLIIAPPAPSHTDVETYVAEQEWNRLMECLQCAGAPLTEAAAVSAASLTEDGVPKPARPVPALKQSGTLTRSLHDFYEGAASEPALLLRMRKMIKEGNLLLLRGSIESQKQLMMFNDAAIQDAAKAEIAAASKEIEISENAGKGRIISLVCSWVMGAGQVATGVFKLCTFQPQGVLDLGAGLSGLGKSVMMTIVVCHPGLESRLQPHIDRMEKAEFSLGMAATAAGLVTFAGLYRAASAVIGTARRLTNGSLGMTLLRTVNHSSGFGTTAANQMFRGFGQTVAKESSAAVKESLNKFCGSGTTKNFIGKTFSEDRVEAMCTQAMEKALKKAQTDPKMMKALKEVEEAETDVAKALKKAEADPNVIKALKEAETDPNAMKALKESGTNPRVTKALERYDKAVDEGIENINQLFAREVTKALRWQMGMTLSGLTSTINAPTVVASTATSTVPLIVKGSIDLDSAKLQEEVDELQYQLTIDKLWMDFFDREIEHKQKERESRKEAMASIDAYTSKGLQKHCDLLSKVASSTV